MAGANDISLTWTMETKKVQKALKELDDITAAEARKMAKEWRKAHEGIEKTSKRATDDVAKQYEELSGDGASAAGKVAGAFETLLGESMGEVAQQATDFFDLMEVGFAAGPVGAAALAGSLAVLGGAYQAITGDIQRAAAEQQLYSDISDSLEPIERALELATLDRAAALGQLTDAELRQAKAQIAARQAVLEFADGQAEARDEINAAREDAEGWLEFFDRFDYSVGGVTGRAADAIFGWSDTVERSDRKVQALDKALVEQGERQKELRAILEETAVAQDDQTEATERQRAAASELARVEREREETLRELQRLEAERAAASAQIESLAAAAVFTTLDAESQLAETRDAKIAQLHELAEITGQTAEVSDARMAIELEHEHKLAELRAKRKKQAEKLADAEATAAKKAADEEIAARMAVANAYVTLGGMVTKAWTDQLEERGNATRRELMLAFRADQAYASVDIGMKTAQGIMDVWSKFAATPPIAAALTVGVAAMGAVQHAQVMSQKPKFHQGTSYYSPDEGNATLMRGEAVLTAAANRENPGLAEAMNKREPVSSGGPAVLMIGHKAYRAQTRRDIGQPGSYIRRVAREGQRVGHGRYP